MSKIEKMTLSQARKALDEDQKRHVDVTARIEAIRPPKPAPPAPPDAGPTGWRPPDPLATAGPEYQKCVEDGDAETLAELTREYETLRAEQTMLDHRLHQLKTRVKVAEEQEALDAAPGKASDGLKALPGLLDAVDAALLALADALEERDRGLREIDKNRELLDNGAPFYAPALLRRVWGSKQLKVGAHYLRKMVSTREDALPVMVAAVGSTSRVVASEFVLDAQRKLKPPSLPPLDYKRGTLDEIRAKQEEERQLRQHAEARAVELAREIA